MTERPKDERKADGSASIDLYWLPLGAGGWFVRFNGHVYEALKAFREHRQVLDLYHTALIVNVPEGRFVIENAWPIPDTDGSARGCIVEGPVFAGRLARFRSFRYEVRRWRDGTIADIAFAVDSPQRVSNDEDQARFVLDLVGTVPPLIWGRRVHPSDEMWNSNSVIAWLLTRAGAEMSTIEPPPHGRAPGWSTGVAVADEGRLGLELPGRWTLPARTDANDAWTRGRAPLPRVLGRWR